jgi:hypothetical protein
MQSLWKKVVKRQAGVQFCQVAENMGKINFEKCPKDSLRYDIMVL